MRNKRSICNTCSLSHKPRKKQLNSQEIWYPNLPAEVFNSWIMQLESKARNRDGRHLMQASHKMLCRLFKFSRKEYLFSHCITHKYHIACHNILSSLLVLTDHVDNHNIIFQAVFPVILTYHVIYNLLEV